MKEDIATAQQQNYTLYLESKRPVKEFFWTLTLSHFNTRQDYLTHTEYQDNQFVLTSLEHRHRTENYQARSVLSKGFYEWNLKASIEAIYNYGRSKQAGQGIVQPSESHWLSLKPKLNWTPTHWLSASYQANLNRSQTHITTTLPALWEVQQHLSFDIGNEEWNLTLGGEHYYNELSDTESKNTWLADASLQHSFGKWKLIASLHNLFNQKEYRYTTYSDVRSYTSWIKMRPREVLVSMQYRW